MSSLPATAPYIEHRNEAGQATGGPPELMRLQQGPLPSPGPDDILIAVAAAGVNRPDVLQRQGKYPPPANASPLLGLEVAGHIAALGTNVTRWRIGDPVCALTPGGGYAAYCLAPAAHCLPIPAGLSLSEAAALPETCFTVWANVFQRAALKPGETLLIHGGSSGIGSTAIQLARRFAPGGQIIVTCGDAHKIDYCLRLGAHAGINYRSEDFVERCKALTDGRGADVILDMVGAPYFQRNLAACATDGRIAQIAFLQGARAESLNLQELLTRRLTWTGSTLRARSDAAKAAIAAELERTVWPAFAQDPDALRPHIHARFPLARAADAHRMMEAGEHLGKIILEC